MGGRGLRSSWMPGTWGHRWICQALRMRSGSLGCGAVRGGWGACAGLWGTGSVLDSLRLVCRGGQQGWLTACRSWLACGC